MVWPVVTLIPFCSAGLNKVQFVTNQDDSSREAIRSCSVKGSLMLFEQQVSYELGVVIQRAIVENHVQSWNIMSTFFGFIKATRRWLVSHA